MSIESYINKCINALPPERRDIAKNVLREITEDGADSFSGKFLLLLEATNAYLQSVIVQLIGNIPDNTKLTEDVVVVSRQIAVLTQQVTSMRHLRVSGVLGLMAVSSLVTAGVIGSFCWSTYNSGKQAIKYIDYLDKNGLIKQRAER